PRRASSQPTSPHCRPPLMPTTPSWQPIRPPSPQIAMRTQPRPSALLLIPDWLPPTRLNSLPTTNRSLLIRPPSPPSKARSPPDRESSAEQRPGRGSAGLDEAAVLRRPELVVGAADEHLTADHPDGR